MPLALDCPLPVVHALLFVLPLTQVDMITDCLEKAILNKSQVKYGHLLNGPEIYGLNTIAGDRSFKALRIRKQNKAHLDVYHTDVSHVLALNRPGWPKFLIELRCMQWETQLDHAFELFDAM
jgi:hypothetical protein